MNSAGDDNRVKALGGLVVLLAAFLLSQFRLPESSQALVPFALAAVVLELLSPKYLNWGYQSMAVGVYLAVACRPLGGPVAFLLALNAMLIRAAIRGKSHARGFVSDLSLDLLPLVSTLCLLQVLGTDKPAVAFLAFLYAGLATAVPFAVFASVPTHQIHSRRALAPMLAAMGMFGLFSSSDVESIAAAVALYGAMVYACWELARTRSVSREELAEAHMGLVREQQDKLYQELEEKSELARHQARNRKLLEAIQRNFVDAQSAKQALSTLLKLTDRLFKPRSIAIFMWREEQLLPYLYRSPDDEALRAAELTANREPAVDTCWREYRPFSRRRRVWTTNRLLPQELSVMVAPIPGYGVLYLGQEEALFDRSSVETLSIIGRQASFLLQTLSQKFVQKQQIAYVSDEKRRLSQWLVRLEHLLSASQALSACKARDEVYQALEARLGDFVPYSSMAVLGPCADPVLFAQPAEWNADGLRGLVQKVAQSGASFILHSFPKPLQPPVKDAQAVLVVPMNRITTALALVECETSAEYSQEHKQLAEMIAGLAESALLRIKLQEEYLEASKAAAIGQMAAGLSHELNTPFGVIQLEMERAQMALGKNPEKAELHLERAESALDTGHRILKALLYYTTSYAVEYSPVRLDELLKELIAKLGYSFVRLRCEGRDFTVQAFQLDIHQLFEQILFNAVEAVEGRADAAIDVEVREFERHLEVSISDNGPGIPDNVRDRIFEPFFTTKPVGKGLGLGLAVALQIARLHKGSVSIAPTNRQGGAAFKVELPKTQ